VKLGGVLCQSAVARRPPGGGGDGGGFYVVAGVGLNVLNHLPTRSSAAPHLFALRAAPPSPCSPFSSRSPGERACAAHGGGGGGGGGGVRVPASD
jgi:hypothetical protein